MDFRNLGFGLGARAKHYDEIVNGSPRATWFEALTENYMGLDGSGSGRPLRMLKKIREKFPVVFHGVSMSIGSTDPLDQAYMKKLQELISIIEPEWISDHICWTGINKNNSHDLLPIPYTEESLKLFSEKVDQVQNQLKRKILLENPSSYIDFSHSDMMEWEFINGLVKNTGCGLLLDVNNISVSAFNHKFDAHEYLREISSEAVGQIHLAGHSDMGHYKIDTHDQKVVEDVWDLYRKALLKLGPVSTMIEWDGNIPTYEELESELDKARVIHAEVFHAEKSRSITG